jgi:hypothetical protein
MIDAILIQDKVSKNNTIRFRTKMGFDNIVSKMVEEYVYEKGETIEFSPNGEYIQETKHLKRINILEFCKEWLLKGYTPIFEYVSTKNQIVLSKSIN